MAVEEDRVASTLGLPLAVSKQHIQFSKIKKSKCLTILTSEFFSSVIWDDPGNFLDMGIVSLSFYH